MKLVTYIEENAEALENDQRLVVAMMHKHSRARLKEAMYLVDWPEVFSTYADKTLRKIEGSGTNLQFEPRLNTLLRSINKREMSVRNPKTPPKGNGMGADGGQA